MLAACAPTSIQPVPPTNHSAKQSESSAAEINNALATIAMNVSLAKDDYQIGSDDLLQITLFNVSEADSKVTPRNVNVRVSQKGLISLPLLGEIKASGMTAADLEAELKKRYENYIYSPQIAVLVVEYRQRVSVIGAVLKPGVIELSGPKTVIDILAMAGGVTDRAGTQVHIYRQGANGRESQVIDLVALASNASLITANNASVITMPVIAGDVINVPPAGMFFVEGAIIRPGSYPLGRRYSLTQALAAAGGVNRDLHSPDITIFRRKSPAEMASILVDLEEVRAGSVGDPQIEADDVIVVPINSLKYVYHRVFGQILGWGLSIGAISGS